MNNLQILIDRLKVKSEVDAVFIMGSQGNDSKPYSDIDLGVILYAKPVSIKSIHTWIDEKFADIFLFDHAEIDGLGIGSTISANGMDAVLIDWLATAAVQFDKSGKISELIKKRLEFVKRFQIPKPEKDSFWQKISYNFVNNKRYYESNDPLYLEALELRLLYSVSELITAYFEFRDMPWRGDKNAVTYFKENDREFYDILIRYTKSATVSEKFSNYLKLVERVFPKGYHRQLWNKGSIYPLSKNPLSHDEEIELVKFWESISS